jgi:hypothetical protein
MRHLQLYESFGEGHKVAAYDNFPEYREFKLSTIPEANVNNLVQWFREDDFKSGRRTFPVYVADNTWEFSANMDKPPVNWPESKPPIKVVEIDQIGHHPSNQNSLETSTGCSYQALIAQAKSPEEVMAEEILEDPTLTDHYSRRRPMIYAKAVALMGGAPSQDVVDAASKWKRIKRFL